MSRRCTHTTLTHLTHRDHYFLIKSYSSCLKIAGNVEGRKSFCNLKMKLVNSLVSLNKACCRPLSIKLDDWMSDCITRGGGGGGRRRIHSLCALCFDLMPSFDFQARVRVSDYIKIKQTNKQGYPLSIDILYIAYHDD